MASYGKGSFNEFPSYQGAGTTGGDSADRLAQNVGGNIQKISQNVSQLERMVRQIGTPQDSEELRDKVSQTTQYTNQLAKETNRDMKDLAHLPLPSDPNKQRHMKLQKEKLTEEFSNVLKSFQTIQRTAAEKERASLSRARASSSGGYSPFQDEPSDGQFSQQGYSQTAQVLAMENDVDLNLMKERETAIHQLEKDIMDVNQIFKDLGMLVHEQGEVLDSIEANVEHAEIHVSEGTQQLSKARDYQSKARRKKCCLIVVLLVILAVIGIIIAIVVSNNN